MKCYIAGPLFTEGDRWYLEKIDAECEKLGLKTYLPHRDAGLCPADDKNTQFYFQTDYQNILESDFLVAVLHGTDVDSGTAWEIGCAYANGKQIFAIADDIRVAEIKENINLMISNSVELSFTFSQLIENLRNYIHENGEQSI